MAKSITHRKPLGKKTKGKSKDRQMDDLLNDMKWWGWQIG